MEEVLDMSESPAALEGDTVHFWYDDTEFQLEKGEEPHLTGGLKLANSAADALVLQCYETESLSAFGHELTAEQWRAICGVKEVYDALLFTTHAAAVNIAYPLVSRIREELQREDRKFMFLCGHDSNICSVLAALEAEDYSLPNTIEKKTPIGSKLVVEKWEDSKGQVFAALKLVYQSTQQLRSMSLLDLENPPMVYPIRLKGLNANADGLYLFDDLVQRFTSAAH
jgi:glucose-1-phosphatase